MADIKEQTLSFVGKWLQETDPARKLFDVLTISLGLFVAGALFVAYNRQDTVLAMLGDALDKYPTVNSELLGRDFDRYWEIASKDFGAMALQVDAVDLSDNSRIILRLKKTEDCPSVGHEGMVKPYLSTQETPEQLKALSDLITGDFAVVTRAVAPGLTGLYIPLPDRVGRLLCGVVVVSFPIEAPMPKIRACRTALINFTDELAK